MLLLVLMWTLSWKNELMATRDARAGNKMAGEWGSPVSPSSFTTIARLETNLAQVRRFILGGILTKTAWESVTCVKKYMKTLAAFRISITKYLVGYQRINSYASLIWVFILHRKGLHIHLKERCWQNWSGNLITHNYMVYVFLVKLNITTQVNCWGSGNE